MLPPKPKGAYQVLYLFLSGRESSNLICILEGISQLIQADGQVFWTYDAQSMVNYIM